MCDDKFCEVESCLTDEEALSEAKRCLNCKSRPCVSGCPVGVMIPEFISEIKLGNINGAYKKIVEANSFPAICGRVCPQENQCEANCVRGRKGKPVAIGKLERYAADTYRNLQHDNLDYKENTLTKNTENNKKVAVIGAGPSGLACAGELAKNGIKVTVFEALHEPGGVLLYGIPEFRLPKDIVRDEIKKIKSLGVEIKTNMVMGKILSVDDLLKEGFSAVYLSTGAGLPKFMGIEGESLCGVYSANEFLTRVNLMRAYKNEYDTPINEYKNVIVVGGGNVAMDAARTAKRLLAKNVYLVYRRSENEMPARAEEIYHAKNEGINFKLLTNPVRFLGNDEGKVIGAECVKMQLCDSDSTGRKVPVEKENSNFVIEADCVIIAIGNKPNLLVTMDSNDINIDKKGCVAVNNDLSTSKEYVYAGGDLVTGAATVIKAMGMGRKAARSIIKKLNK